MALTVTIFVLVASVFGALAQKGEVARADDASILPVEPVCKEGAVQMDTSEKVCNHQICKSGVWVTSEVLLPDVCCKEYGELCDIIQPCKDGDTNHEILRDECIICTCVGGQWECSEPLDREECCAKYKLLCECEEGQSFMDIMPNNDGCFKCACRDGFWVCLTPIYTPGECCELFQMEQFCDYQCNETEVDVIVEKDHCVVCHCVGGSWVCTMLTRAECCTKHGYHCKDDCCVKESMKLNLRKKTPIVNTQAIDGIVLQHLGTQGQNPYCNDNECICGSTAVIKATFDKIKPLDGCVTEPLCGKRMLKIQLTVHNSVIGGNHTNVGDSSSNNGYGGDGGTQENDAEAHGHDSNLLLYKSDKCNTALVTFSNVFIPTNGGSKVTIWISNKFIRVATTNFFEEHRCSDCLYALNGQSDNGSGGTNEDVYIALNRVIAGGRYGTGICKAKINWVCPCDENDWQEVVGDIKPIPGNKVYDQNRAA
ncbi:hypothetical protein ScPMuIL_003276 [Solemya velum]